MHEERLAIVKKEIRSVIITYPKGVSLNGFLKAYHQLVGIRLPSREFGFTSDVDFLYSLTDIVKIQTDRNGDILLNCIVDESTEHIQKLVGKQRVVKTKTKNGSGRDSLPKAFNHSSKIKPFVSASLRKNLFEVLKDFPDGINYNSLQLAYQRKFKRPLNLEFLSESRYDRLRKLEMAVSELHVKVVDETERLFYYPLTRNTKRHEGNNKISSDTLSTQDSQSQKIQLNVENFETADIPIIPRVIKEDFEKVLKLYPDGVLARHFPFLYEKTTGEIFDLADLGYNNFLELADALPDVFICIKPYESPNEWMIFHPCFSESAEKFKKLNETLQLSDERFGNSNEGHNQAIPSDIVLPTQPYHPAEFPSDINLSLYIPVFISVAINPGCFWFKLHIEEVICRFRELEDEMQSFYHNEKSDIYQMSMKDIKIGSTCVAMHENHWYRTTITSSPNADSVNVYVVDYGGWEKVPCSRLRYLKNSFISLPGQAFKAQLASIKPLNNAKVWSKRATNRFLQLCIKSCIMAKVELEFDDSLSVLLCDTSGDDDIDINAILLDENLAESYSADNSNLIDKSPVEVFETYNGENNSAENSASVNYCADSQRFRMNGESQDKKNSSSLVERAYLGDDYWTHIIMISDMAYMTATDLCNLFWHDKSAEVLKSRLQCKDVEIPTTTVLRDEQNELFLKCEKNGVHGFSPLQQSVELYPLFVVMKVLNSLGHPSVEVRETIQTALQNPNNMKNLLRESANSCHVPVDGASSEGEIYKCCLYDLKAMQEAIKFKRLMLQEKYKKFPQTEIKTELNKVEALSGTIQERIRDINSICLSYSKYE
ncbi:tudor domain-containing protein 5 isoform X2 [Parasteatoda tepidariorum]|uniref:tudor domain-containing protein 5 isoform X2 n=1 Tax=Parasteatoda tepidariorum TaxID=114398 RepID=UPI001C722373|nr:tudor domain-containing protein 5 isoform X2 [Parasteatoda tepidariorum]